MLYFLQIFFLSNKKLVLSPWAEPPCILGCPNFLSYSPTRSLTLEFIMQIGVFKCLLHNYVTINLFCHSCIL